MKNRLPSVLCGCLVLCVPSLAAPTPGEIEAGGEEPVTLLLLLQAVQMLRADVLEQRLEGFDERIEHLDRELGRLGSEIAAVRMKIDAADDEVAHTAELLSAPDVDEPHRAYLEAMRDGLERRTSGPLGARLNRLEAEENESHARRRALSKDRNRLVRTIECLRNGLARSRSTDPEPVTSEDFVCRMDPST